MGRKILDIKNPYNGETIGSVAVADGDDVRFAGEAASKGARTCARLPRHQRASILRRAAEIIRDRQEDFASTIVRETGKTIRQARKEVLRCVNTLELSAIEAGRLAGETIPFDAYAGSETRQGYFTRGPLGVVLAITPYNDPLNLVAHKVGPAIAGGNSVILKPSEYTPFSALAFAEALLEAGLPQDIISVINGDANIGRALVSLPQVRMVSFTGGPETGEAIIREGGLKKYAMDLGGNAPVIVLEDCNFHETVTSCISGSFWAAGQNCIGVQRILVADTIYKQFCEAFVSGTNTMKVGDPTDEKTDMGPMISVAMALRADRLVSMAINAGARCLAGGHRKGSIYYPTVLTDVSLESLVWSEEVFAPIVLIHPVANLDQALELANASDVSLQAGIFTNNLEAALKAADNLEAGGIMINDSSDYRFDAMPFGGFKRGSMGREGVRFAIEDMTQPKVICFNR